MNIRKAKLAEAKEIQALINKAAEAGVVLPRSLSEIYENIRDFWVAEEAGKVIACCALHLVWEDLAEARSLVVAAGEQGKGLGQKMLAAVLEEGKAMGVVKVFALTAAPDFFRKAGFEPIAKEQLPHKIWGDCLKCPKFPQCDEVALWKRLF